MKSLTTIIILTITAGVVLLGCSESTEPEDHQPPVVTLSTAPATITAGDTVEIEITVEDHDGNHMGGLTLSGEIHLPNDGGEVSLDFHASTDDEGHYHAEYTFAIVGTYELHCSFMHDGENVENHFDIVVQ